jgi:hypothetical protein
VHHDAGVQEVSEGLVEGVGGRAGCYELLAQWDESDQADLAEGEGERLADETGQSEQSQDSALVAQDHIYKDGQRQLADAGGEVGKDGCPYQRYVAGDASQACEMLAPVKTPPVTEASSMPPARLVTSTIRNVAPSRRARLRTFMSPS